MLYIIPFKNVIIFCSVHWVNDESVSISCIQSFRERGSVDFRDYNRPSSICNYDLTYTHLFHFLDAQSTMTINFKSQSVAISYYLINETTWAKWYRLCYLWPQLRLQECRPRSGRQVCIFSGGFTHLSIFTSNVICVKVKRYRSRKFPTSPK